MILAKKKYIRMNNLPIPSFFILYQLKELQSIILIIYQHSHNHNIVQDQPNQHNSFETLFRTVYSKIQGSHWYFLYFTTFLTIGQNKNVGSDSQLLVCNVIAACKKPNNYPILCDKQSRKGWRKVLRTLCRLLGLHYVEKCFCWRWMDYHSWKTGS